MLRLAAQGAAWGIEMSGGAIHAGGWPLRRFVPHAAAGGIAHPRSPARYARRRWRKVTIWARVQGLLGLKVAAEVPLVMLFSTAQATASR